MKFMQKLVTTLLPKAWAADLKAESERWWCICPTCGSSRSIWEVGGIRYKAVSTGKQSLIWCTQCQRPQMMAIEKKV